MAVSKRLRFEILRRDEHKCQYCGRSAPEVVLTVDHVVPVSLGGRDDPSNLRAACRDCNSGKSSSTPEAPLVAAVAADADRWAAAIKQASELNKEQQAEIVRWFKPVWYPAMRSAGRTKVCREAETNQLVKVVAARPEPMWPEMLAKFLASGLSKETIEQCVSIAANADVPDAVCWRYFCGCCRNKIQDLHAQATEIVTAGGGQNPLVHG